MLRSIIVYVLYFYRFFVRGVPKNENWKIRKNWIIVTFYRFSVNFLFELLLRFIPFEYERGQLGWSVCNEFWSWVQFKIVLSDSNWERLLTYRWVKANSLRMHRSWSVYCDAGKFQSFVSSRPLVVKFHENKAIQTFNLYFR